jgi:hypothetical protein
MKNVTKDQFITVLDDAGVTEAQKARLHAAFEKRYPDAHQSFLEMLGFPAEAIRDIRVRSRTT